MLAPLFFLGPAPPLFKFKIATGNGAADYNERTRRRTPVAENAKITRTARSNSSGGTQKCTFSTILLPSQNDQTMSVVVWRSEKN